MESAILIDQVWVNPSFVIELLARSKNPLPVIVRFCPPLIDPDVGFMVAPDIELLTICCGNTSLSLKSMIGDITAASSMKISKYALIKTAMLCIT